jgi:excisionase family DNA binding protein
MPGQQSKTAPTTAPFAGCILDEYLTKAQLASALGVSVRTLNRWHDERVGPDRIRVGRKVLYSRAAVARWLEGRSERGALLKTHASGESCIS